MTHVGDEEVSCRILSLLWDERGEYYRPFAKWPEVQDEEVFMDLARGLMNLNPAQQLSAQEALKHPWF
jgi:serine/threonine protein kinase